MNQLSPEELEKIPTEEFGEDSKAVQVFCSCFIFVARLLYKLGSYFLVARLLYKLGMYVFSFWPFYLELGWTSKIGNEGGCWDNLKFGVFFHSKFLLTRWSY